MTEDVKTRVGFIGLGSQGGPMAERIVQAGYATSLWARRAETLAPFEATDAVIVATPAELAERSDVLCICVVDDERGRRGLARTGRRSHGAGR